MDSRIHLFQMDGFSILLDINSGVVHMVDSVTYELLHEYFPEKKTETLNCIAERYSQEEVQGALQEIKELEREGLLFTPDLEVPVNFQEQPIVKSICLHVAHDCNLRCGYCFAGTGDFGAVRGLMPVEIAIKAVDFLIAHSGSRRHCEIDFFGGEPLMNMATVKATVAYIRQKEQETGKVFKLTLTTNGVLLDEETIRWLNDNDLALVLSLDGRKKVHDRMRPNAAGKGSYDQVAANFRNLVEARRDQNYFLRGTYTAYNLDFSQDVLAMVDAGFRLLSVEPVVAKEAPYQLLEEHLPQLFAEYETLAREYCDRKLAGQGFEFFHFNLDLFHGPCVAKRLSGCGAGHEYMAVTPEGDLYPCHQFVGREEYKLGTVFAGIKNKELPKVFRNTHVLSKEECRRCWARYFCSGGCHANAQLINGDLNQPYRIGCELQRKRLECALYIQARLATATATKSVVSGL